ncbi:MAG: FadR/GntR family transcriptional regulator [Microcella sp.]|uniref:FadR/GntR family transcriptional regulator n=1 Tax=Microcella sp. TaxID=1913979 RepID=UPI003315763B
MTNQFDLPDITLGARQSLPTEIARKLLDYILESQIAPGTRIPSERQLALQLDVGRSAVREALKSLSLLGMIEVRQGDGTYIRKPDASLLPRLIEWGLVLGERRILDLIELRRHLEIAAASSAALKRDEEDLVALRSSLALMKENLTHLPEYVEADLDFHSCIASASKNSVLADFLTGIRALLKVWMSRVANVPTKSELAHAEHAAVLDAIERQDEAAAGLAMRLHLEASAERLRETLPPLSEAEGEAALNDALVGMSDPAPRVATRGAGASSA